MRIDPEGNPLPARPLGQLRPAGAFFEGVLAFPGAETHTFAAGGNTATYSGNRYGAPISVGGVLTLGNPDFLGHWPSAAYSPAEVQTAYGLSAVYNSGYEGTGETIVIIDAYGSPTITDDAALFSQIYGLPPVNLTIVRAPGLPHNPHGEGGWDVETTLDVEWAHAIAPDANIVLVYGSGNSLPEAINYAVVHHFGNTISNSWAGPEDVGSQGYYRHINRILEMAAAQGIDVNFSSGDFGDNTPLVGFVSADFPPSSPFATGVGGTSLALNSDGMINFQTGWGTNATRVADISPSGGILLDDNPPIIPPVSLGFFGGSGGGESVLFAQPSFQNGFVPVGNRMVPDISWLADPMTGVEIIQTIGGVPSVEIIGGTSLSCPMFSGLMAIAAQKNGHVGLGQAAALVYGLGGGAVTDIVPKDGSPNNVTGTVTGNVNTSYSADFLAQPLVNTTTYYNALYNSEISTRWLVVTFGTDTSLTTGPSWDNVTGLGTPNGLAFINAIAP